MQLVAATLVAAAELAREMEENHEEYLKAQQVIAENMARQIEEEANRMIQEVLGHDNKWSDSVINRANRIKYNI